MLLAIIVIIIILLAIIGVAVYNGLVRSRVRVDEAWSDINVQLKRRYDLIPNLVNTVQGYAAHEKKVFTDVTQARTAAMNTSAPGPKGQAENQLAGALKSLFAVSEAYPDLKANESFQQLQSELVDTEDKIQAARRFYNGSVRDYNMKLQVFPTSLFASSWGFTKRDFFGVDDQSDIDKPVEVKF